MCIRDRLVVMLGILVDDAIVVADNYVELLDQGHPLSYAAEHCAKDIVVPLLVACLLYTSRCV